MALWDRLGKVPPARLRAVTSTAQTGFFPVPLLQQSNSGTETSDRVFAGSSYFVDFDLLVDHTFILTGLFENTQSGGFAQSFFNTFGPTNLAFGAVQSESVPVNETGVLLAGSYGLLVNNNINNGDQQPGFLGGTSSYQFDFRLTALNATPSAPEPGTLALLGLGLFGIGFSRRG